MIQSWRFGWIALMGGGLFIILAIVDVVVRIIIYKIPLGTISAFSGRFITSPGAAGLAALAAAIIGAVMISKQLKLARATAHESEWWSKFEWVTERALPSSKDHTPIPENLAINFLNSLQGSAQSALQQEACGGFADHLVEIGSKKLTDQIAETGSGKSEQDDSGSGNPTNLAEMVRNVRAWTRYVNDTQNTPARSVEAERALYQTQVFSALTEIEDASLVDLWQGPSNTFHMGDAGVDAELEYKGKKIFVVIRNIPDDKTREFARISTKKTVEIINRSDGSVPWIIISRTPLHMNTTMLEGKRVEALEWTVEKGTDTIKNALDRLVSS